MVIGCLHVQSVGSGRDICILLRIIVMLMYEVSGNASDLFVSLLGMCEVMGLHDYIALVELDWVYR